MWGPRDLIAAELLSSVLVFLALQCMALSVPVAFLCDINRVGCELSPLTSVTC